MLKWWQERVVYQIWPRSFQDSNGDGIGDLQGIIAHLDELKDLGVGVIWLSPVYPSPNVDFGYDISDYKGINPELGTMADMEELLAEAEKREIKIVMDLVINHTSDQHAWFQSSRDKDSPYRDYYIWRPGKNGKPPNNWSSFFGGPAWTYDERRGEYYLHLFAPNQPDLNYYNPKVMAEVKDVMRFWLDKGVAGFRCDVINIIYKSSLADGRRRFALLGLEHYLSQEGCHKILRELRREVLSQYDCFTVGETVFITPQMARDFTLPEREELDMVFAFEHMETDQYLVKWFKRRFQAGRFARSITKWQTAVPWNANYLENHDQPRSVSRFGHDGEYWEKSAKLLCTLLLTLRGTPFIYQGQEIGMTNFDFTRMEQLKDVESHNIYRIAKGLGFPPSLRWRLIKATSRDNARTPMQWNSGPNAGFTTGTPWLGVNKNHVKINMESQMRDPNSIRNFYRKMIALRAGSDVLKSGDFTAVEIAKDLFVYRRTKEGSSLLVLLNFSTRAVTAAYRGELVVSNYDRTDYDGRLQPYEAVVLEES
ncbi:alpha-glucosidase [Candidatus Darwinibacter acetoxidans]|jgi:oligo-1,6-glucosidase|nr:alpha-glucosidase [Bacillota bacterium]